jgi:serine-type D-Ala-D-Ala carboxypeptidase (penicillin-binding protein 5/6)
LSTDELVFTYPPTTGVKTGTTPGAGSSLVATVAAEDEAYFSVILDTRGDRFAVSIRALEHGFAAYDRRDLVAGGEKYAEADVPYRRGVRVGLVAKESVEGLVDGDPEARREVRVFEDLPGSAKPDTTLGEGRPRSSPARTTTRPRCGSGCGIQSGGFLRRRGRGQRRPGR